jgi:hypothetical protein
MNSEGEATVTPIEGTPDIDMLSDLHSRVSIDVEMQTVDIPQRQEAHSMIQNRNVTTMGLFFWAQEKAGETEIDGWDRARRRLPGTITVRFHLLYAGRNI